MDSPDPFTVDFDPRWAGKLVPESFARKRYLRHIHDQAMHVMRSQNVGVLFTTPPVLESLGDRIPADKRMRIGGIHLGGMPVTVNQRKALADRFPRAVILSGYGNTLFGMAPELAVSTGDGVGYYPHDTRMIIRVVKDNGRRDTLVPYGERGRVVVHRFDETQFIANMIERDTAVRIRPVPEAAADGFVLDGLRDPQPLTGDNRLPVAGLY